MRRTLFIESAELVPIVLAATRELAARGQDGFLAFNGLTPAREGDWPVPDRRRGAGGGGRHDGPTHRRDRRLVPLTAQRRALNGEVVRKRDHLGAIAVQ